MPDQFPELRTARLTLSGFDVAGDVSSVFAYASDPEVACYTSWTPHASPADSAAWLVRVASGESMDRGRWHHCWAIRLRDGDGKAVGAVTLDQRFVEAARIDYVLARPYWRQGLMTEAVTAVIEWMFDAQPELTLVQSGGLAANVGSIRVMQKCGLTLERTEFVELAKFGGMPREVLHFGVTRRAWAARRAPSPGQQ